MKIGKKDALMWFRFFASLPEDESLTVRQTEIALAVLRQIEVAEEHRLDELRKAIPNLKTMKGRTYYVGPEELFPKGCLSCLFGSGLGAVRRTNRCNLQCPFCYDYGVLDEQPPVGEGLWEIGGGRIAAEDLPLLLSIQKKPSGVAYVYLEPFMEIEKYYPVIRAFHEAGVYQHMYTNGTLATEENLRALAEAGLDELRFNLGASRCARRVIDHMALAAGILPAVGIETPMTEEFFEDFHGVKDDVLRSGIRFINCAELHLNENNLPNYLGADMVMTRLGYLSPIFSRELTMNLMAEADRENWPVAVHDCSNHTKMARDWHLKAREGGCFGATTYGMEFDTIPFEAFLPVLEDDGFRFVEEEPLPAGYRVGDIVI